MERTDVRERRRDSLEARLAPLTARQHGAFSRAQAKAAGGSVGVIQRRLETGRWTALHPNVFAPAGTPPSWLQRLSAALLAWGDGAVLAHLSAAALWQLSGFDAGPVEILAPRGRCRVGVKGIVVRTTLHLPQRDITVVRGLRVTSVSRTLFDIAAIAPRDLVEEALDDALRRRLTSVERLRRRIDELSAPGRAGVRTIQDLLDERPDGSAAPGSVLETKVRRALRIAGLPPPRLQHAVSLGDRRRAIVDLAYVEARIAIEVEGYRVHSSRRSWDRDRDRMNELTARGWRVLRVTSRHLEAGLPEMIAQIARLLDAPLAPSRHGSGA